MGRILCNEAMLESGKQVKWICKRICRQTTQTTFGSKCTSNHYQLFKVVVFGTNFFLRLRMRALLCSTNCFACSKPVRGSLRGDQGGLAPSILGTTNYPFQQLFLMLSWDLCAQSAALMTMSLFLCISGSNARDGDEGVSERNGGEKQFPQEDSQIILPSWPPNI